MKDSLWQVANSLSSTIRHGLVMRAENKLVEHMHDPQRVAVYKQLQDNVESLKKAQATLRKL